MKKMLTSQGGFTLLEVLVAVAIVATLAAAVSPTVFQHVKETRVTKAKSDGQAIGNALVRFRSDLDTWPGYADGGTQNVRVNGLLFSEKGDWPKIDLDTPVSCDVTKGIADDGIDNPVDTTITACDAVNEGIYKSWIPAHVDTDTDNILEAKAAADGGDGCASVITEADGEIPPGSEFHSPATLESQLIYNQPIASRYAPTNGTVGTPGTGVVSRIAVDTDTMQLGTASDGSADYMSMVMSNCSVARVGYVDKDRQYKYKDSNKPEQSGWNGAYLQSIPADPWGRKYLVNLHFAFAGTDHAFSPEAHQWNPLYVLSAGPNGLIETPVGHHGTTAPGVEPQPGGDDIVTVINLSQKTTM